MQNPQYRGRTAYLDVSHKTELESIFIVFCDCGVLPYHLLRLKALQENQRHYIIRMTKVKYWSSYGPCWWGCGTTGTLLHCWCECKIAQTFLNTIWQFLKKLINFLAHDPFILFLGIYTRAMKAHVQTKTCTQTFIAAFFLIAPNWKKPKCSSTSEWINTLWCIHTNGILLSANKNTTTRTNLTKITLNGRKQTKKEYWMIPFI